MSVGAICFTSSASNGGCWVVLVFPCPFFGKKGVFFSHATIKNFHKRTRLTPTQKKLCDLRQKKKRVTLISTIELHFPQSSC